MKRNLRVSVLIVLVLIIVGVVLGVFLPGGDEEEGMPARVASVESKSESTEKQFAEPESSKLEVTKPESTQPESTQFESAQSEIVETGSNKPAIMPEDGVEKTQPAKMEEPLRVQEEPSVAHATPEDPDVAKPDATSSAPTKRC